jgi:hypothetical protein
MADMKMGPTIAEILEARKRALGLTNPNSLIPTPGLAAPAIGSAIGQRLGLSTPTTSPIDESINFKLSEISKNPDIAAIQGKEFPKTNPEIPPEVIQSLSKTPETEELPQEIPTYRLPEKKESFWDRPQTLTALKDIAEGGMGVANAMERASLIRIGMNPNAAQHGVAENIRRRIDEREETLSPEERASFQKTLGFDLPQGVTYSKLRMISPLIAQSLRSNMSISPYQKARLEQEEKRLTQSASRLTQGQQRLEMPEKAAIDPIIGYDRILKNIEMVEKGEGPIAQEIGPIASRWNQFKSKIGIESPEWATFRANVYEIVFENLYGKSGKQINEAERGKYPLMNCSGILNKESKITEKLP